MGEIRVSIDDGLHDRAKIAAVRQGVTLREFLIRALDHEAAATETADKEER